MLEGRPSLEQCSTVVYMFSCTHRLVVVVVAVIVVVATAVVVVHTCLGVVLHV